MSVTPHCASVTTAVGVVRLVWAGERLDTVLLPGAGEVAMPAVPPPAWVAELAELVRVAVTGVAVTWPWARLDLEHLTPFRRRVTTVVSAIAPGATMTYAAVAMAAGTPGAARAVGNAMHANPWPLIVPCHRVVAAHGLGGFGGGLALKRRLLAAEGVVVAPTTERTASCVGKN